MSRNSKKKKKRNRFQRFLWQLLILFLTCFARRGWRHLRLQSRDVVNNSGAKRQTRFHLFASCRGALRNLHRSRKWKSVSVPLLWRHMNIYERRPDDCRRRRRRTRRRRRIKGSVLLCSKGKKKGQDDEEMTEPMCCWNHAVLLFFFS